METLSSQRRELGSLRRVPIIAGGKWLSPDPLRCILRRQTALNESPQILPACGGRSSSGWARPWIKFVYRKKTHSQLSGSYVLEFAGCGRLPLL